jgi:hypothetical protein
MNALCFMHPRIKNIRVIETHGCLVSLEADLARGPDHGEARHWNEHGFGRDFVSVQHDQLRRIRDVRFGVQLPCRYNDSK